MNNNEQESINILSESLTDELVGAVGLPKTRLTHWLFRTLFSRITDRLAVIGVPFNRIVREEGLPSASKWVLDQFCHTPLSCGVESIPAEGPLFVISNHPGAYDGLVLFSSFNRKDIQWISSEIPFLDLLPDARKRILFASRKDSSQNMTVLRNIVASLRQGGVVVYFGAGHRDPDPAVYSGAETSIKGWLPIVEPLFRLIPELRVLPVFMSGMVLEKWAYHPITWLRRKQIDKHRLAEFGQVITQLTHPGRLYASPAISFGKAVTEEELRASYPGNTLQESIVACEIELFQQHLKSFSRKYS